MSNIDPWVKIYNIEHKNFDIFNIDKDLWRKGITNVYLPRTTLRSVDWVTVIPITHEDEIVFVRQFRFGLQDITLELPGGMVDSNESWSSAAFRELEEETGYSTKEPLVQLNTVHPNPAFQTNRCHQFLAKNVTLTKSPSPEPNEQIKVVLYHKDRIPNLIRTGMITHALMICALSSIMDLSRPQIGEYGL